jgi:DNA mismatch repair ATPase MutS
MNQCKSSPGRTLIKHWVTNPLISKTEIDKRLEAVDCFMQMQQESNMIVAIQKCFRGLPRIRVAMTQVIAI